MNQFIKIAFIALLCWCTASVFGQVKVINQKGTVVLLDTSKWILSGSNIFNKNTGNLGIGTNNPLAKLHTNGSIRFEALGTNTINTNILTTNGIGEVTTRSFANLLEGSALTSLNGLTQSLQTFATGTSGTDFNISSSSTTHTFNIPTASATSRGLLSTTDWSTFNNKLGNSLSNGNIFVGNTSNVATSVTMSGDATLASTGALTISNNAITSAKLANNAVTIAKLPSGATATTFLRGDGTWVVPTGTTYTGSTSISLNGSSFERAALTGDVTAGLNSNATTIANNAVTSAKILDNTIATADIANSAVTYAKMQNAAASRLIGNPTGSAAALSEIALGSGLSFSGTTLNTVNNGTVTNVTGSSPISVATGTTTPVISISTANATTSGALSNTDWTTFNNKLGSALSLGNVFVGNASNVATAVPIIGDATLGATGILTVSNDAITTPKIANNAITIAKLPSGATATSFLRGDGTWVVPTGTTYTGSTSIALNGSSFERAALTGDVTAALNSNATVITNNAVTSAKIQDNTIATDDIANGAVSYGKIQNVSASSLMGNPTNASATASEIILGSGLSFTGSTLNTVNNGTVTNVTGTSPISVSTGTTTPVVSISTANATTSGALSNTDWTTFNNKIGAVNGTAPITASTTSGTTTLGINRNNIVSGTSSNTATAALTLDGGATNAVVGGANATLTVNNTAPLWNANQLQGRNVVSTAPANGQVLRFNGTDWAPATESAASNWLITGNANTTNANFLGTTNDVEMSIRSNNTTMFQVGRRQTLALWDNSSTGIFPYNQQNASVAYIRGTGGNSSLQFEASGASFYKPIFFTDSDGNFKMRGSSAGTDFFELGSAGASNLGSLEFIIGDDGNEPMSFKKYNYRNGGSYKEILRIQGSADDVEANSLPRVGINVNETTPTSTLQNNGSFSLPINTATAGTFTVTELMYTIIIPSGVNAIISLPSAAGITGRIYVIKNNSGGNRTISSYRDLSNTATTTVANNSAITLQSDGTNWQRIQ